MPGVEKLHLEDALEDNPQSRSLLSLFEQDAQVLKKYIKTFYDNCERILNAQKEMASATSALSHHLKVYEDQAFPLDTDPDSILRSTLRQFASILDEVSCWQQVYATQLSDGMIFPLTRFLEADLAEISTMGEMFHNASNDLEQVLSKFCKIPKRKDNEKLRQDTNVEVYLATKKFHQLALHYYANMNALQYKRKSALVEPLLGYINALKSHFQVGHESMNTPEVESFMTNISSSVEGVQSELGQETRKTVEQINSIEQQSQHMYYAEPLPDMPYIPPNTSLNQKSGYLFYRTKFAGMVTKWERMYFYTLGGHLMGLPRGEVVGSPMLELDRTIAVYALEQEDRRNVFYIGNGKKAVVVQALNERERDEWIATIHNITKESLGNQHRPSLTRQVSKDRVAKTERSNTVIPVIASSENISEKMSLRSSSLVATSSPPPTTPVSNANNNPQSLFDTPIQFDMFSPSEDERSSKGSSKERPQVRINPFDQTGSTISAQSAKDVDSQLWETFVVRFLGSMQVKSDRGEQLVYETIRHIMATRAIHNIFKMTESNMVITHQALKILDPAHQSVRAVFPLEDVCFWTTHKENNRLLGFITRTKSESESPPVFHCHVFESNTSAEEICSALATAANIAVEALVEKMTKDKEKKLLLENLHINEESVQPSNKMVMKDGPQCIMPNEKVQAARADADEQKIPLSSEDDSAIAAESRA